ISYIISSYHHIISYIIYHIISYHIISYHIIPSYQGNFPTTLPFFLYQKNFNNFFFRPLRDGEFFSKKPWMVPNGSQSLNGERGGGGGVYIHYIYIYIYTYMYICVYIYVYISQTEAVHTACLVILDARRFSIRKREKHNKLPDLM